MRILILLFPWVELFTLIQLGVATSALSAIFYVLLTLVAGLLLLRNQGFQILGRIQERQQHGGPIATTLMADELALGLAAILLIIPGLITDACALLVVIGPLRRRLAAVLMGRQTRTEDPRWQNQDSASGAGPTTIDGEFRRLDDD